MRNSKSKRRAQQQNNTDYSESKGSTASRFVNMMENQFREYPQVETVALQAVSFACRGLINFLNDLEIEVSTKIDDGRNPSLKREDKKFQRRRSQEDQEDNEATIN